MKTAIHVLLGMLFVSSCRAADYQVGTGKPYATLASLPALQPGDLVEIFSGTYHEVKRWSNAGAPGNPITVRGVGSTRPVIDATGFTVDGSLPNSRAVFQVEASYITIENVELVNARNSDNGAGFRVTSYSGTTTTGVILRNCKVDNNDMGIMCDSTDNLLIESCDVGNNGTSLQDGFTHNFYLGGMKSTIQYCYIHDSPNGQNFKTRGHYTELLYNFIANSQDGEVGLVDDTATTLPNSNAVMIGNIVVSKPRLAGYNSGRFIQFGQDSGGAHPGVLYCVNNTFIAGDSRINFLDANIAGASIAIQNNIFYNSTTLSTGNGPVSGSNNWMPSGTAVPGGVTATTFGSNPGFVNFAGGDYHLISAAACVNLGANAPTYLDGSGVSHSAVPTLQYVHPLQSVARAADGKLDDGAFEFGTVVVNAPPAITSGPAASVPSAAIGQSLTFTVAATDPNNDPLTYTWNFGDGTTATGASVAHSFAAAGTFTVSVNVSDPGNLSVSGTVSVTTTSGGGGTGGSGGTGGGGNGTGSTLPMTVSKAQGSVTFKGGHDSCKLTGVLPNVPAGFVVAGQNVVVNFNNVSETFTLAKTGRGSNANGTVAMKFKLAPHKGKTVPGFVGGNVPITIAFHNGTWAAPWGFDATATTVASTQNYAVSVVLGGTTYAATLTVTCALKPHVGGKFKL